MSYQFKPKKYENMRLGLWCLTPISTIFQLYRGVQFLLVKETGVSGENHWQSLSHNVVSSTPCHERGYELTTLVVIGTDCTGSCKSNYHRIMAMTAPKNTNQKTFRSGAFSRKGNELPFFYVPLNLIIDIITDFPWYLCILLRKK